MPRGPNDTTDLPCLGRLAPNLKRLVSDRGYSTRALSRRARVSQAVVAKLLRGENDNPQLATILRVARALGVSLGTLLKGE